MQEMAMGNKIEAEMYSKDSFKKDYFTCNTREGEKKKHPVLILFTDRYE